MKHAFILFIFCLFFQIAWGEDTLVNFHGSKISLPHGFKELKEEQLNAFKAGIVNRQIMSVYEKETEGIQRLIVYYDSLEGTKNMTFKEIVEIKLEVIKGSGIAFDEVKVDESNRCVYGRSIILGDTTIFGFSVDAFGMMGIQFDHSSTLIEKDFENFKQMITSIKHASPYSYIPAENPAAKKAKKDMENSGVMLTIAFVAMLLIWLIRKLMVKSR